MGKNSHSGFTPPKGKPTGNGRESTGLRDAFAGIDRKQKTRLVPNTLMKKANQQKTWMLNMLTGTHTKARTHQNIEIHLVMMTEVK